MRLLLAYISPRRELKSAPVAAVVEDYVRRCQRYAPVRLEAHRTEAALVASMERQSGRVTPSLILLDSRGTALTSVQFAQHVGRQRDEGKQEMVLAIGPPDGWLAATRDRANLLLSLGAMTLPHELALAVLSEQVYRALTILAGHPYHAGHA